TNHRRPSGDLATPDCNRLGPCGSTAPSSVSSRLMWTVRSGRCHHSSSSASAIAMNPHLVYSHSVARSSRIALTIELQGSPLLDVSVFISWCFQRTSPFHVDTHADPSASIVKPGNRSSPGVSCDNGKISNLLFR